MRLVLAFTPLLLLVQGCSTSGGGGVALAPVSGSAGKADANGPLITPIIDREVRAQLDPTAADAAYGDQVFPYDGQSQVTADDATGLTFHGDMIVFTGPCTDDDVCLFKMKVTGWPTAVRALLYTREPGSPPTEWKSFGDLRPGIHPDCLATALNVQVDATDWDLSYFDQNGQDCSQATPTDVIPAWNPSAADDASDSDPPSVTRPADTEYGLMVYPAWIANTDLRGVYAFSANMDLAPPPGAPTNPSSN